MNYYLRFKESEHQKINEWLLKQSDWKLAIFKLIYKEIKKNGIKDVLLNQDG